MKQFVFTAVGVGTLLSSSVVSADGPAFQTTWYFRVSYLQTDQYVESSDPTLSNPVLMPIGSPWKCQRLPASLTKGGGIVAGYACWTSDARITIAPICNMTAETTDFASAVIAGSAEGGSVYLQARCGTSRKPAAPPRTSDKSL